MPRTVTVKAENATLDLLLFRAYGVRGQALIEEALELNPGLAAKGLLIPFGEVVTLPDLPQLDRQAARAVVTLFD